MGRKTASGLLIVLYIALTAAAPACRSNKGRTPDPGSHFSAEGEVTSRTLGIYSKALRIGTYRIERIDGRWSGFSNGPAKRQSENLDMRLSFMGEEMVLKTYQESYIGPDLTLLGNVSSIDFGGGKWDTKWLLTGTGIYAKEELMGRSFRNTKVRVPDGAITTESLSLYISGLEKPETGGQKVDFFNLTLGRLVPVNIEYRGVEDGLRHYSLTMWGMVEDVWVDARGMVAKETMPWGLVARQPGAADVAGALSLESVFTQTAVPSEGIPDGFADQKSAVIVIDGLGQRLPSDAWQEVKADGKRLKVTLKKPVIPVPDKRSSGSIPVGGDDFGLNLGSVRIQELARQITDGIVDPWEKAEAIGRWVYNNLGKSMRECFSALEALESGEGECQAHSLLAMSLLRTAKIPSRFAYGAVYMPDRGHYLFHTWVQVHVGEWIPIDPTLGSFPAGVDHLTLAAGEYMDQFQLFPYIQGGTSWRISYGGDVNTPDP